MQSPLVSLVTPCLNMAKFLPATVASIRAQSYGRIEHIVVDGGSEDGTVEWLRKHGEGARWISEPDAGPADALRKGFAMAQGELLGWLNADDRLMPGAVSAAVEALEREAGAVAVYGDGEWSDEAGAVLGAYPTRPWRADALKEQCVICQPACFFSSSAYRKAGGIDARWRSAFDYDLWIRLARQGPFVYLPRLLASACMHRDNISLSQRARMFEEGMQLLKEHFGYVPWHWIYGESCYRRDRRDQFFEPLRPSVPAYLESLVVGLRRNWRQPLRYLRDWGRPLSLAGLLRLIRRSAS